MMMMVSESPGSVGSRKKIGLSLLEEARSRYESLQISDDLFGESGEDSSGNPFYSTSPDSRSSSKGGSSEDDDDGGCREDQPSFMEGDVDTYLTSRPEASDLKLGKHNKPPGRSRSKRKGKAEDVVSPAANAKDIPQDEGERGEVPSQKAQARLGEDLKEEEGWSHTLQDVSSPSFKETSGSQETPAKKDYTYSSWYISMIN
ncbi:PREDICTED: uncharacterized protein LOC108802342 [Nanorana parkeri]|uniref:uncharacterized protein LOC108802342 n=1 Tax=Nanorana parkeri TaxID=125878 RepID=UPI000854EA27|nr:PREDICTED: uncharacterized protein LOC108802342 [Nanorana parkeri]